MTKITITITESRPGVVEIDVTPDRKNPTQNEYEHHMRFMRLITSLTNVICGQSDKSVILDDVSQFTPEQIDAIRKRF